MNKKYNRGRLKEWAAKEILEAKGYNVTRTAGSHGAYDICATRNDHIYYIQHKRFAKATTRQKEAVVKAGFQKMKTAKIPNTDYAIPVMLLWIDYHGWEAYYAAQDDWQIVDAKDLLPEERLDIA